MRLAAGIVTYADWNGLERTLDGLWGCDKIFVIHCRFRKNPIVIEESLEKTVGVCKKSRSKESIELVHMESTEFEARQMYLNMCKLHECDYLLIIDSDEYIQDPSAYNWGMFRFNIQHVAEVTYESKHNVFGVWQTLGHDNKCGWEYRPRLWYKPSDMMYKSGSHFRFINKKDLNHYYDDYSQHVEKIIEGIRIIHSHDLRLKEMEIGRRLYHEWLIEEESRIGREVLNRPIGRAYPKS